MTFGPPLAGARKCRDDSDDSEMDRDDTGRDTIDLRLLNVPNSGRKILTIQGELNDPVQDKSVQESNRAS
jgi:hypothetical protein